jgi:hypothetical protein
MPESTAIRSRSELSLTLPPAATEAVVRVLLETGDTPGEMFRKALGLYMLALDARERGKVVGAADSPAALETEFTSSCGATTTTMRPEVAQFFGDRPEPIGSDFKIIRPDDPEEARRAREKARMVRKLTVLVAGTAFALALALCWLSLHHDKADQAEKVVATAIGLVGGIGIGRAIASKGGP